ncbi:hypothetical protein JD844_031522 [Phrynosoma platyrhinos]|uniref:OCA domain-containing protein n=1 Tax=Phrynosoma platyrhinos TaxID=52577 RepID=A0ABQ7T1E6_PHRPL|nr:hypothetical protein JD844_031522 [Phrynosoma platyrhinos]
MSGEMYLDSGKPKIYQGVRVKITVKELLQQRRAKQAVVEEADTGSPDSSDPSSSFDYSYSPPQLPPFAPICYNNSPSSLEAKSCMYPSSEGSPYPLPSHVQYNHVPSACCCTSCGTQHLDTFRVSECFPYTNADCRDYVPSVSVADDFFRRDRSWDTCYS